MEVIPATRNKLGAVIVGEGFEVTSGGVLSVRKQNNYVEISRERLEELFEASKARRQEE